MSIHRDSPKQIRLLIPQQMVRELDSIAASRQLSRLAIIRRFLRMQIDEELSQLETYFEEVDRRNRTHERLQEHLSDNEW
jgi:metal-responsive CopG/Arc/MetJ family transcriptional regulator